MQSEAEAAMGLGLGDGGKGQQEVSFDCTDAAFASDHFRMYEFKVGRTRAGGSGCVRPAGPV